ncbi:hypothetical protein DCAR_0102309 [Daucus carota subsp. sativus]|uniref:Uncharacterized protein n=1 Tax=Daucus carota subsp. sativus TaxID=79200 RepID=A0A166H0I4_DAUCS|nr:hypothetical protein DCAR_0102309 [Daucus carota subsp. sativus]
MGRERSDQTVIRSSSIALLQERFRQLQKVKELREEKEMFRFFPESDRCTSPPNYNTPLQKPFSLFFESEVLLPSSANVAAQAIPTSCQIKTCLSLWPDHSHVVAENVIKKSHCLNNKSWLSKTTPLFDVSDHDNETDVDTSLHL